MFFMLNRYLPSHVDSEDGIYRLYFKPTRSTFNSSEMEVGLYLQRIDGCDGMCSVVCSETGTDAVSDWHSSLCSLLAKIDLLDFDGVEKEKMRKLVWDEIVCQSRLEFEKNELMWNEEDD